MPFSRLADATLRGTGIAPDEQNLPRAVTRTTALARGSRPSRVSKCRQHLQRHAVPRKERVPQLYLTSSLLETVGWMVVCPGHFDRQDFAVTLRSSQQTWCSAREEGFWPARRFGKLTVRSKLQLIERWQRKRQSLELQPGFIR